MNYAKVNKWCSDKVGQDVDIERAECREIIRERFKIETQFDDNVTHCYVYDTHGDTAFYAKGETIAEAECAFIIAIWEASKDE